MKNYKIILSLLAIGIVFSACKPNKDLYKELDATASEYSKNEVYSLSAADYSTISKAAKAASTNAADSAVAASIATLQSLNSQFKAEDYIPAILTSTFKGLGNGSSAMVTYNNFADDTYGEVAPYTMSNSDYAMVQGSPSTDLYFTNTALPKNLIPGFLKAKYPDAVAQTSMLITFKYPDANTKDAMLFTYNGSSWVAETDVYALSGANYTSMGNPGPGKYGNFSATDQPSAYLPTFLKLQFPYAVEGTSQKIAFNYYDKGGKAFVINTKYEAGIWKLGTSSQFINNGEKWVFDPTVHYEMTADDHQFLVEYVRNNPDLGDAYFQTGKDDREFYFGANSKYVNFNVVPFYRTTYDPKGELTGMTDAQIGEIALQRINDAMGILIKERFPNAQPIVNGIPVYYELTYLTYGSGDHSYFVKFLCTAVGVFELQPDQPTLIK